MSSETVSEFYRRYRFFDRNKIPSLFSMDIIVGNKKDDLTDEEYSSLLKHVWSSAEWPEKCVESSIWAMLFGMVSNSYFVPDDTPDQVTLYRGCVEGHERGLSWTNDIETAKWFATRFGDVFGEPALYKIVVDKESILAVIDERGESEYIVSDSVIEDIGIEQLSLDDK